jgi:glycosyltransferase involved in cell wall biosynthesis
MKMTDHLNPPLITTIIPTYRRPRLLARAIKSVLNQTYPHFQVCVYDNASGDETPEVVAEFARQDSRVKYHCHPEDIGSIPNFDYGLRQVNTPFFSLLSDDDILLPNFYRTALAGFEQYPDASFSAGATILLTDKGEYRGNPLTLWTREGYFTPPDGLFEMIGKRYKKVPTWTSILFRKELLAHIGYLDNNVGYGSDVDFELRAAAHFPFVITKQPCAIFFVHALSHHYLVDVDKYWLGWLNVIQKIASDESLPAAVRELAAARMKAQLENNLFSLNLILKKNFSQAYRAAQILRDDFQDHVKAATLYTVTKLCEHMPIVNKFLLNLRKLIYTIKFRDVKNSIGDYSHYLDTEA